MRSARRWSSLVVALHPAPACARAAEPPRRLPTLGARADGRLGRRHRHLRRDRHRLRRLRHFPRQPGDLPRDCRLLPLSDRRPRPGRHRGAAPARRRRSARGSGRCSASAATCSRKSLFIVQGVARLALVVIAAAAVLEPWGVQSQDWFSSLRAAYFGFSVGGVTLSLSSMLAAVGRVRRRRCSAPALVQSWLSDRLLPQTRLDRRRQQLDQHDLRLCRRRRSRCCSAAPRSGSTCRSLAIVAGALSVGIGFGLQSIANNFVSGLILLWERGIRVGDWVVVGADQGFVRKINARATEIETFDRATLIVPNSNLVSGRRQELGPHRPRSAASSSRSTSPTRATSRQVREILIAAAKAQDLVLSIPAPTVLVHRIRRLGAQVQPRLLRRRGRDGPADPERHQFRRPAAAARCPRPRPLPDAAAGADVVGGGDGSARGRPRRGRRVPANGQAISTRFRRRFLDSRTSH